jgi:hypothetical protein
MEIPDKIMACDEYVPECWAAKIVDSEAPLSLQRECL